MTDTRPQARERTSTDDPFRVERLASALGALVTGVDLAAGVDDGVLARLQGLFLEHQVLCLRGQQAMSPRQQLQFAARWGEVSVHPYVPSIEGHPGVMKIHDPTPVTQRWHADTTHAPRPPALTLLLARVIPPLGGDTMWADAYGAYEQLSPGLRATLDTLRAVHRGTELAGAAGLDRDAVTTTHPVVRTHPDTGRKALFVNGDYTSHFEGWTTEESAPLLAYLYAQVARPELVYRHRWQVGDLVIWDNRCTQHAVVGDTGGAERVLHRVTIAGDRPY
ncbi:TauD/TfdA dioxygenase family protein [Yinghuangia seranimata]|uniref:TauD/TfdA dioxygenase family protein n=1 Tax=Yinghuangia seranimata TaxID=408067 RepID=UPI00248D2487|nr:TauD/TfdA family dioxygenase [Yinghuangia seranimata]MDI2129876.1 TauD/TfdA family dioxygenase [Yinghuangia seranimata]